MEPVIQPRFPSSVGNIILSPSLPFPLPTAPQLESSNRVILLARMSCGHEEFRGLHETSPRLSLSPPFDNVTSRKVSWLVVTCRGRRKDGEGRQRSEISRELRSPGDTVGPSEREMGMQRRLRSATFATSAFGLSRLNNFPPTPIKATLSLQLLE